MSRDLLEVLTEAERNSVEENCKLVDYVLRKKGYSDELYDVGVFGLLKGVQSWHRHEDVKSKWSIEPICLNCIKREIGNYFRDQNRMKRRPSGGFVSLDADYSEEDNTSNFHNYFGIDSFENSVIEREAMSELLGAFSKLQQNIVRMKAEGYNNKETYSRLGITPHRFNKELEQIRIILINRCN